MGGKGAENEKKRQRNASGDSILNGMTEFEMKKQRHASGESTLSADSISHYIPTPPDGGYGWVIVFAAFMNHVIVDGIASTFGIFYSDFLSYFDESKGKTALVGALLSGFYLLMAPVAGALVNKFGCRSVSIFGSIVAASGFFISAFSVNVDMLMIFYGVIGGSGLGILYLPNIISVSYYFQRRRAFATGIAVCGAGVGCFIFAPIVRWLLITYGWQNSLVVLSGISLNGGVFGALLRPLVPARRSRKPRAKNILDRLKEQVQSRNGKLHDEMINSESRDLTIIQQRVQEMKLARENALHEEEVDSESGSMPSSVLNSVQGLSPQKVPITNGTISNGTPKSKGVRVMSLPSDTGSPSPLPEVIVEEEIGTEKLDKENDEYNDNTNDQDCETLERSDVRKTKSLIVRTHVVFNGVGGKFSSAECIRPCLSNNRKLPRGIHREDYARPLYRGDIFYSGSMLNIPEFRSQPTIVTYAKSITTIPYDSTDSVSEFQLCPCLSISKSASDILQQMTDVTLLRDPLFLIPCLANMFAAVGLFIPYVYITERAMSLGIDDQQASFLLSVLGITNTFGRILTGCLADLSCINPLLMHNLAIILAGVACIFNMFCTIYSTMCLFAAFFGLCIAVWISLTSIVLCNILGLDRLTNAFGLLMMTRGIATLIGGPLAGLVYDATKTYDASFHIGGGMLLLGGSLCCFLFLPCLKEDNSSDNQRLHSDV